MVTGTVRAGSGVAGTMTRAKPVATMLKAIVLPELALAFVMARRRLPAPLSLLLLTVNVAGASRSSRHSRRGRKLGAAVPASERPNQRRSNSGTRRFMAGSCVGRGTMMGTKPWGEVLRTSEIPGARSTSPLGFPCASSHRGVGGELGRVVERIGDGAADHLHARELVGQRDGEVRAVC